MARSLLVLAFLGAVLVGCVSADAEGSGCFGARAAMLDQRAELTGLRAAYVISVEYGYVGHVAKLGPRLLAGGVESERLLAVMYRACDVGRS